MLKVLFNIQLFDDGYLAGLNPKPSNKDYDSAQTKEDYALIQCLGVSIFAQVTICTGRLALIPLGLGHYGHVPVSNS